jgi:eukaryotic-like serine/threonine-protein kinase
MAPEPADTNEREQRRNEILAACLEDPELADEVAAFLADHADLARLAQPLRAGPAGALAAPVNADAPTLACDGGTTPSPAPVRSFGDYELLAEIARGGMGVVYRARQKGLNRVVALKMTLAGGLATREDLHRFRTEAEAAARLRHPNIVTVHEVGEVDGQPFFSMEFIEGPTLAQRLAEGPVPGRTAAAYVRQIARAVDHAHLQGILHRDLKPSNIILDQDDQPCVTDFGLARRLDAGKSILTQTGMVVGTPSYMAPEQAAGKSKDLGPACDVYGLGAVLYELLTGRAPFRAESTMETLLQVMESQPAPPRLLNAKIDRDLETICLKCLEKEPGHRYASAEDLAADLDRYLAGELIAARSLNLLGRLVRTLERNSYEGEYVTWGSLLMLFGIIQFVCSSAIILLAMLDLPLWYRFLPNLTQFGLMALAFWRHRPGRLLPTTPSERQLWSIWIGYFLAYGVIGLITLELADQEMLARFLTGNGGGWWSLSFTPYLAVISGLGFFVMGSNYWGGFYAIGLAFLALAVLMPLTPGLVMFEFTLLWSATLILVGLRLRRLGVKEHPQKEF